MDIVIVDLIAIALDLKSIVRVMFSNGDALELGFEKFRLGAELADVASPCVSSVPMSDLCIFLFQSLGADEFTFPVSEWFSLEKVEPA